MSGATFRLQKEVEELNEKVGTLECNVFIVEKRTADQGIRLDRMQQRINDVEVADYGRRTSETKVRQPVESTDLTGLATIGPLPGPAKKPCKCQEKEEHQHGPDFADGITIGLMLGILLTVGTIVWHRRIRFMGQL